MADQPAADKTEPPTRERIQKARDEGQIPQAKELTSAMVLVSMLLITSLSASQVWEWFTTQIRQGLGAWPVAPLDPETFVHLFRSKLGGAMLTIAPFLAGTMVASVLGTLIASGWVFAPKAVRFRPNRLNPIKGLKGLLSPQSAANLVVSVVKLAVFLAITVTYLRDKMEVCLSLTWATPLEAFGTILSLSFGVVTRVAIAYFAIAVLDTLYQRWQYKRQLRMTRQEVKEERRQHEAPPEVRGRIRAMQFEMARKRIRQAVPEADVVITNPTHVAVALKYDATAMAAPLVVAKGADYLCETIKEIARTNDVPIVQRPELARALYSTVEVGEPVPEALYVAVAEVLAMIYRLRKQQT